jgi:MerR family transcriptional regulator, light-induced transcriptional regulator
MPNEKRHPIRVVARRTGLTPEVLRVWEKRYGLVTPARTGTGRRVYSDSDIERLRLVRHATLSGRRVGDVSRLSIESLEALAREDEEASRNLPQSPTPEPGDRGNRPSAGVRQSAGPDAGTVAALVEECMEAVRDLDGPRLEATLNRALMSHGSLGFIEGVIAPLMRTVGELWEKGRLDAYSEHLATSIVRQTIARLLVWPPADSSAPLLVVTTPAGQRHELGAILAASTAQAEGWRVVYLGADLPARDIARAAEQVRALVVALSLVYPPDDPKLGAELSELRERLPKDTKIIAGGPVASSYERVLRRIGAQIVTDIHAFREVLARIRSERTGTS